jgi:hypothetical protein
MLMLGNSEAMVLCIGQDGHVAIEASGSGCCGHLPPACCPDDAQCLFTAGSSAQDDDCGMCLDIPISSGVAEAVQAPNEVQPDSGSSFSVDLLVLNGCSFIESSLDLTPLTVQSYFPLLRSVILLI